MSLTQTIKTAVSSAFVAIGDLKLSATFTNETGRVYNPATMTYDEGTPVEHIAGAVKWEFKQTEYDGNAVKNGDSRFMVQTDDLTSNYRDYDSISEGGRKWEIIEAGSVPGESVAIYHVRLVQS